MNQTQIVYLSCGGGVALLSIASGCTNGRVSGIPSFQVSIGCLLLNGLSVGTRDLAFPNLNFFGLWPLITGLAYLSVVLYFFLPWAPHLFVERGTAYFPG